MLALQEVHGLPAALAALLPSSDATLGFLELLLSLAVVAWVLSGLPVAGDEKHRQPHINAGLASGARQRLCWHLGTGETGIPAVGLFGDRNGLRRSFQGATPAHRHTAVTTINIDAPFA